MKVGQIRKLTIPTLRGSVGENLGWCEVDIDVVRNCRLVLDESHKLKWQIIYDRYQYLYERNEIDEECLSNMTIEEALNYKGEIYDTYTRTN